MSSYKQLTSSLSVCQKTTIGFATGFFFFFLNIQSQKIKRDTQRLTDLCHVDALNQLSFASGVHHLQPRLAAWPKHSHVSAPTWRAQDACGVRFWTDSFLTHWTGEDEAQRVGHASVIVGVFVAVDDERWLPLRTQHTRPAAVLRRTAST